VSDGATVKAGGMKVTGGVTVSDAGLYVKAAGASVLAGGLTVTGGVTVSDSGLYVGAGVSVSSGGMKVTGGLTVYGDINYTGDIVDIGRRRLQDEYGEDINQLTAEVQRLREMLLEVTVDIFALRQDNDRKNKEIEYLKDGSIKDGEVLKLVNAQNSRNEEDIKTIKAENAEMKAENARNEEDIKTMKAENAEMKAENARNEEDIKTMKAENARNEEDIKTMKDALYSALTRIDGYIEKSK
jgi:hypothetical protein